MPNKGTVNTEIPFLVELCVPADVRFEDLQFDTLRLAFSNGKACEVRHAEGSESDSCVDLGEVSTGKLSLEANLRLSPGEARLFRGTVQSADPGPLEVSIRPLRQITLTGPSTKLSEAALTITRYSWTIELYNKDTETSSFTLQDSDEEVFPSIE